MILNAEVVKLCLLSLPPSPFVLSPGCYWSSIALQWREAVSIYGIFRITIRVCAATSAGFPRGPRFSNISIN